MKSPEQILDTRAPKVFIVSSIICSGLLFVKIFCTDVKLVAPKF